MAVVERETTRAVHAGLPSRRSVDFADLDDHAFLAQRLCRALALRQP